MFGSAGGDRDDGVGLAAVDDTEGLAPPPLDALASPSLISREQRRLLTMRRGRENRSARQAAKASAKRGALSAARARGSAVSVPAEDARHIARPSWLADVHPSHRLVYVGGIFMCERCGSTGTVALDRGRLLRGPCRGYYPSGSAGRTRALLSGRLPSQYSAWRDSLAEPSDIRPVLRLTYTNGCFGFA